MMHVKCGTGDPADVIKFLPVNYHSYFSLNDSTTQAQRVFLCGTYKLVDGGTQEKIGKLITGQIEINKESSQIKLTKLKETDTKAILDLKCLKKPSVPLFIASDSSSQVKMYRMNPDLSTELQHSFSNAYEGLFMYLSVDISELYNLSDNFIISSRSDGKLDLWDIETQRRSSSWKSHDYECWTCSFDYWDPNLIYSGGDDCFLNIWDKRETEFPVMKCKRHEMGVTSIASHPTSPFTVATGSYDKNIYVWDHRHFKTPISSSIEPQGGVWRLSWNPLSQTRLLSACMHGGVCIYHWKEGILHLEHHYKGHESIVYGIDWSSVSDNEFIVASCSFYDSSMHFWPYLIQ